MWETVRVCIFRCLIHRRLAWRTSFLRLAQQLSRCVPFTSHASCRSQFHRLLHLPLLPRPPALAACAPQQPGGEPWRRDVALTLARAHADVAGEAAARARPDVSAAYGASASKRRDQGLGQLLPTALLACDSSLHTLRQSVQRNLRRSSTSLSVGRGVPARAPRPALVIESSEIHMVLNMALPTQGRCKRRWLRCSPRAERRWHHRCRRARPQSAVCSARPSSPRHQPSLWRRGGA